MIYLDQRRREEKAKQRKKAKASQVRKEKKQNELIGMGKILGSKERTENSKDSEVLVSILDSFFSLPLNTFSVISKKIEKFLANFY